MCCITRGCSHICHWYRCGSCHGLWSSSLIIILCATWILFCLSSKSNWNEPHHSASAPLLWALQEALGIFYLSDLCDAEHVNSSVCLNAQISSNVWKGAYNLMCVKVNDWPVYTLYSPKFVDDSIFQQTIPKTFGHIVYIFVS